MVNGKLEGHTVRAEYSTPIAEHTSKGSLRTDAQNAPMGCSSIPMVRFIEAL